MYISLVISLFLFIYNTAFAADLAEFSKDKELKILRIIPQGDDVATGSQIVIQFNRPVVPIGAMERNVKDIPIKITPNLECQWRWLNNSSLSCNLGEKDRLKESTLYKIVVKPGIKAQDGQTIENSINHQFITARANISYSSFKKWLSPSVPLIRLVFNQPVTKDSVMKSLFMTDAAQSNKEYFLNVDSDPNDHEAPKTKNGSESRIIWLVTPKNQLPSNQDISLKVRPGLVSAFGEEKGIANREVVRFRTFPEFKFLGIKCKNNDDKDIIFIPNQEQKDLCNPMSDVYLSFSSPVLRSQIGNNIIFDPALNFAESGDMWNSGDYSRLYEEYRSGKTYDIELPRIIKPNTLYKIKNKNYGKTLFNKASNWILAMTNDSAKSGFIKDEFSRTLIGNINISFKTNHRKPNFEINHHDAVIESGVDSQIPLYVNNIDNINFNYSKLTSEGSASKLIFEQKIPKAQDVQFATPLNVRQMLGGKSGVVYGFLNTNPLVKKSDNDRRLFAQVTPYQIHAKIGHFNSIIWVTDMASGLPVVGAKVVIYKDQLSKLSSGKPSLSQGITSNDGVAILSGTKNLDPNIEFYNRWKDEDEKLFIRVDKDDKMALLPVSAAFLIDSYRSVGESVYYQNKELYGHIKSWGTTAQGVYRAGDTIQYKFYVRNQNNKTLTAAPKNGYDLEIIDPIGNKVFESKGIKLNAFGAYSGEYSVSATAAVGWYQFVLTANFNDKRSKTKPIEKNEECVDDNDWKDCNQFRWTPIRVLVSDFTPSPFKVTSQVNGDLFHFGQKAEVITRANLHSGGVYGDANVRITTLLQEKEFESKHPAAKDFIFGKSQQNYLEKQILQKIDRIDAKGEYKILVDLNESGSPYGKLLFESAVQDDRGKYVTSYSSASYVGVDRFVGLKMNDWILESGKASNLYYLVTDEQGKPISGTKVNIKIKRQETKVSRVKGAGNAYLNEFTKKWINVGSCQAVSSDSKGICKFTPNSSGYYRITAQIEDTKGKNFETDIFAYAVGKGYELWDQGNDYSLEIIPQKTDYKVGDKAKFLIKNPYPGAKALVSIERYGVIDHFVRTLDGSSSIIEFEVKPDYIPGFYLSVVVFSPRVEKPIEGQVDLGKPSFKIGYLTVPIKDKYKQMTVSAKTDKNIYKPREKVSLSLHAEPKVRNKKEPIEFAVAVLDESVFDLISGKKSYFDPYQGFYKLDGLDLRNYSLLTRLVGRQKFEKKGANPGGDGGSDVATRNLFKFVSYWNPSIIADKNGNAKIEFEAPDNLTGWRVLAIAVTPSDIMGLGDVNFKVNRPTEIRPVMPNQITEGDEFNAGFSVMNRTDKKRDIIVKILAKGSLDNKKYPSTIEQKISLEPYKRKTIWMPIEAKNVDPIRGLESLDIEFTASAGDDLDKDALSHKISVKKSYLLETAANYGTATQNEVFESVKIPNKIRTDVGNISLSLSPSVIGNVSAAFKYLIDYPYSCFEQILTKGVMASYYINLSSYLSDKINWKEARELPDKTLKMAANFQAPNGGMAYFVAQDNYADPYLSAYTALSFNWLKNSGYKVPHDVESKLHKYLDNFLKKDAYPDFYNDSMASTVRAVALAALAENNKITIADLERHRSHLSQMSLFGKTHFAKAATYVQNGEKYTIEASNLILSHANQSAGKFTFSESVDVGYERILSSPLRENCAILSLFVRMNENPKTKDLISDIAPKLANMITDARGDKAKWENTQENMFCVNAIADYAKTYESVKPELKIIAKINGNKLGEAKFTDFKNPQINLLRNLEDGDSGKDFKVSINSQGQGRIYYNTQVSFARKDMGKESVNSGMEITREYSVMRQGKWQLLKSPMKIKPAEIVKVDIFLNLAAARNFVVVNDPVPGGLEPVNRDLATTSIIDDKQAQSNIAGGSFWFKYSDWISYNISRWSFNHKELKHDSVRFYSDYLPAGRYLLSYTAQAIAPGEFTIMPVYVGEMYNPDIYGRGIIEHLNVQDL